MSTPQEKRDELEIATLFQTNVDGLGRQAIIRSFERMLAAYLEGMLAEDASPERVLFLRNKAMGLLDALTQMGVGISHAMSSSPIKESVRREVAESLTTG